MSGRYWVLASDELMSGGPDWPEGLRVIERGSVWVPGMRWWLFEDDTALDDGQPGQGYELVFTAVHADGRDSFSWCRSPIPGMAAPCCEMHGQNCEPPGDLCCAWCTEARHPAHPRGECCSAPGMSILRLPGGPDGAR